MKLRNVLFSLPLIATSLSANAEIQLDAENGVSYTGMKNTNLQIKADGSALINGTLVKKCEGNEGGQVTKSKLGSVTCDDGFVILKDRNGDVLSRFSSYALATDNRGTNERKLFDPALAKLGSPTTGAAVLSQKQITTVEETKTVETLHPGEGYLNHPKIEAPNINETTYTPKLGVMAEKTPSITKENRISDTRADHAVAAAEKAARTAPPGATRLPADTAPVVLQTTTSPATVETKTVTTVEQPTPSAAAAGVQPGTQVQTQTETLPSEQSTSSTITAPAPIPAPPSPPAQ